MNECMLFFCFVLVGVWVIVSAVCGSQRVIMIITNLASLVINAKREREDNESRVSKNITQ